MAELAIELIGVNKRFGEVHANKNISFGIRKGAIHGIIGENGAGKSTLMSILYGYYQADSGSIRINGQEQRIRSSQDAIAKGIGMVHQHFMLVDPFTVLENIVLGAEEGISLESSLAAARRHLADLNRDYGLQVDPDAIVGELGVGSQQRVEILKALYRGADVLILDEPTAVLTPQEADDLFRIMRGLRDEGKTIILITHKLREMMDITDDVTVMRGGEIVGQVRTADVTKEDLADLMVGRKVNLQLDKAPPKLGDTVLSVSGLNLVDERGVALLKDIGFELRAGEIVGIGGVSGNGQSELLEVLSGMREASSGSVRFNDTELTSLKCHEPKAAAFRKLGIAHVPEDRSREGLVKDFVTFENAILGQHNDKSIRRGWLFNRQAIVERCRRFIEEFDVRPALTHRRIGLFSGGNQQKVILAREIHANPQLMLIGQPTRGVDIGAIEFIHQRLLQLRDEGKALLLVSVELDEILALSDRIIVMNGGAISGELPAAEATATSLGLLMGGHK